MKFKPDGKAAFFTEEEQADSQDSRWGAGASPATESKGQQWAMPSVYSSRNSWTFCLLPSWSVEKWERVGAQRQ